MHVIQNILYFAGAVLRDAGEVVGAIEPAATIALAILGAFLTWRAFALQRQSTSTSGLDFLHVGRHEHVTEPAPSSTPEKPVALTTIRQYYVTAILSHGPATRYQARGVVWGEGSLKVLTPQLQVWGPGDPAIEFELKTGPNGEWEDVYCGVIWERPHLLRNRFTTEGYRVKVERAGTKDPQLQGDRWDEKKNRWVPLKSDPPAYEGNPAEGAAHVGASFNQQLADQYPDDEATDLLKSFGKVPKNTN